MSRARVVVIADGFHRSYRERLVAVLLEDGVEIVGPAGAVVAFDGLDDIAGGVLSEHEPDIACVACGPWVTAAGGEMVSMGDYERGVLRAAEVCRRWCGRQVVFVTTPPVEPSRYRGSDGKPARDEGGAVNRAILRYNQLAAGVLGQFNLAVADLYPEVDREREECVGGDGVGLSGRGIDMAAAIVAKGVCGLLRA